MREDVARIEEEVGRLLDRGDLQEATTHALRSYGPQVLGYLCGLMRDEGRARDVFSIFREDLWRGIGAFRRDASLRVWVYTLAWHAAGRVFRDPYLKRGRRLETVEVSRIVDEIRSMTSVLAEEAQRDVMARFRQSLSPDEQTLLTLRVDREQSWEKSWLVLAEDGVAPDEAALRKRFQRVKNRLRKARRGRGASNEEPRAGRV